MFTDLCFSSRRMLPFPARNQRRQFVSADSEPTFDSSIQGSCKSFFLLNYFSASRSCCACVFFFLIVFILNKRVIRHYGIRCHSFQWEHKNGISTPRYDEQNTLRAITNLSWHIKNYNPFQDWFMLCCRFYQPLDIFPYRYR